MTSFTQIMPWAFKLGLAKVTGPSLLYMTVGLRVHGQSLLPTAVTGMGLLTTFDSPSYSSIALALHCQNSMHKLVCGNLLWLVQVQCVISMYMLYYTRTALWSTYIWTQEDLCCHTLEKHTRNKVGPVLAVDTNNQDSQLSPLNL